MDAKRREVDLIAAPRFDQHSLARVNACHPYNAIVGRGKERRSRGSVIADRGDNDEAARNQAGDDVFNNAVARTNQAYIDDACVLRGEPC